MGIRLEREKFIQKTARVVAIAGIAGAPIVWDLIHQENLEAANPDCSTGVEAILPEGSTITVVVEDDRSGIEVSRAVIATRGRQLFGTTHNEILPDGRTAFRAKVFNANRPDVKLRTLAACGEGVIVDFRRETALPSPVVESRPVATPTVIPANQSSLAESSSGSGSEASASNTNINVLTNTINVVLPTLEANRLLVQETSTPEPAAIITATATARPGAILVGPATDVNLVGVKDWGWLPVAAVSLSALAAGIIGGLLAGSALGRRREIVVEEPPAREVVVKAEATKAEADKVRAEAVVAMENAQKAKEEAEKARIEADREKTEAEAARLEANRVVAEMEAARIENDRVRAEAEVKRIEAEKAMAEVEKIKAQAEAEKKKAKKEQVKARRTRGRTAPGP